MHTLFTVRRVTAAVLMLALGVLALLNIVYAYPALCATLTFLRADQDSSLREKIVTLETAINDNFFEKDAFIEGYGFVQSALGKEEMDNFTIAKDQQGQLHFVYFQTQAIDVDPLVDTIVQWAEAAETAGSDCLYLMPPSKEILGYTTFRAGTPVPDENGTIDAFLDALTANHISSLDLRETMADSGIAPQDLFYSTDHHWTIQTAFWAFTQLVDHAQAHYDIELDPTGLYTNLDNYNQILYEKSYLGSMGRITGSGYSGVDDFTLIYPKFHTNFTVVSRNFGKEMLSIQDSSFQHALLNPHFFNQAADIMDVTWDKYFAYLRGNYGFTSITNHENPDGANILFIKDSFAVPVAAFLSSTCSQVDMIDPRWYSDDITEYIAQHDYDLVIVSISAANLTEEFFA